jgi:hypothetical protein
MFIMRRIFVIYMPHLNQQLCFKMCTSSKEKEFTSDNTYLPSGQRGVISCFFLSATHNHSSTIMRNICVYENRSHVFQLRVSVHRGLMNKIPTRCNKSSLFSLRFLFYIFRALHSPILRSLNCTSRYCVTV